jgi:hypothetical protein
LEWSERQTIHKKIFQEGDEEIGAFLATRYELTMDIRLPDLATG